MLFLHSDMQVSVLTPLYKGFAQGDSGIRCLCGACSVRYVSLCTSRSTATQFAVLALHQA